MQETLKSRIFRREHETPRAILQQRYAAWGPIEAFVDAAFLDPRDTRVLGWAGLPAPRPVVRALLADQRWKAFYHRETSADGLLVPQGDHFALILCEDGRFSERPLPDDIQEILGDLLRSSVTWPGTLEEDGSHVFDPRAPSPGTHFRINLLLGNRVGFSAPLLTTPKAVVDELGRGSSRFHADRQILATRWDLLPEENGFPCNRQFYLVENGRLILYSAAPDPDVEVRTRHASNMTEITYVTPDGLFVRRILFIPPSDAEVSCGIEAQCVEIENRGAETRELDLIYTGMFGYPRPEALTIDVIYSCVTIEPRVFTDEAGRWLIVAPRYTPAWGVEDQPFHVSQSYDAKGRPLGIKGYHLDYRSFIGNGSLEQPENLLGVHAGLPKRGPAFFAVRHTLRLHPGEQVEFHAVNGLFSRCEENKLITEDMLLRRLRPILSHLADPTWLRNARQEVQSFQEAYRRAFQIETPDSNLNRLMNAHLPFQVRYQTYVSRSFSLTQKGYRRIGFREIQDLFAALPFEVEANGLAHARDLIGGWAAQVYRDGYANHQFYWDGHGPGTYSDDPLWLFQAVAHYLDLTGDKTILQTEWPVADGDGSRPLYETLGAILHYTGRVSIGRHGLPLLDFADWNDTLNLDGPALSGPEKMEIYRRQIAGNGRDGDPLETDRSESVMNGFLLEIARDHMMRFARLLGDASAERDWRVFGDALRQRLRATWKEDFFARALINRPNPAGTDFLGAKGDGLSADPNLDGTYFLNSFTWSILSGIAQEKQIQIMLDRIYRALLTPVGLRLASPTNFRLLMPREGSGDYAYGDRENGGVFKHANMMAAFAMIKAAREVRSAALAKNLADLAWQVLECAAPYHTLEDPYRRAGNPRFCTQYTNPVTGEHIGPLLSGTATWMWLTWRSALGIFFDQGRIAVDPLLPEDWTNCSLRIKAPAGRYHIRIEKPHGFIRSIDKAPDIILDGNPCTTLLPRCADGREHDVRVTF